MNKICSKCGEEKELKLFNKAKWCSGGVRPECKKCENSIATARQKARNAADPNGRYNTLLKHKYGITFAVYKLMLEDQNNACAICKNTDPGGGNRYFCVDHCHKTGRIRGLLCYDCNVALGLFKDNRENLRVAVDYLWGNS